MALTRVPQENKDCASCEEEVPSDVHTSSRWCVSDCKCECHKEND